jgi:drug/metabolite transporter (DMT)-like permease
MSGQALVFVLIQGFLFGSSLLATRFSVGQFHPTVFSGLRMMTATLLYLAMFAFSRRSWPRDWRIWGHGAVIGILFTAVPIMAIVNAVKFQSSGVTSMLLATNPVLTTLLAHFFLFDESIDRRKLIGILVALAGAFLLIGRGESGLVDVGRANPIGYALVGLALLSTATARVYAARFIRNLNSVDVSAFGMFAATLLVFPMALAAGINFNGVTREGYIALGVSTLAGTFGGPMLAYFVLKRFGATVSSLSTYVIPAVAGVGGVLLLGEKISSSMLIAFALILVGITQVRGRRLRAALPLEVK